MTPDQAKRIALALQGYDMIMFSLPPSAQGRFSKDDEVLICSVLNKEGYRLQKEAGFETLTAPDEAVNAILGDGKE